MARPCDTCQHPDVAEIDRAIVEGVPTPELTAKYREISEDSLLRHKRDHIPEKLWRAQQVKELTEGDALMQRVLGRERRARDVYEAARAAGDLRAALMAINTENRATGLVVGMKDRYDYLPRLEALEQAIEDNKRRRNHGFHG